MPLPTDPLLSTQWHLIQTVFGLLDLNVQGVWNPVEGPAYTGAGTRTIVIDDGFDYNHQDFDHYDQNLDFDFEFSSLDPFGTASSSHGTAVSGIIGAAADGTGAVGVAFDTSLVGYRTAELISDAWLQDIRDAISFGATNAQADVANISQGIANDLNSEFGVGYNAIRFDEIEASIMTAVNTGRGGLGMTIVKSAGNSRGGDYDVNADDWTNDTRQVVVAAVNQNGFVSDYSSYGAANLVSGFGTPGEVVTTDRTGAAGYNGTDFTSTFNGTSSAAPMVTGVVSLMYEANAGLGWRDVQSILGVSARHVGSQVGAGIAGAERFAWGFNGADTWNGGGQHFSNDYGYGLVDALAAVRLAETWLITGTGAGVTTSQFTNTMDVRDAPIVIPDANTTGLSFSGTATFNDMVERVTVEMAFSTTFTADMEVYITSPSGTVSQLIADTGGGADFNGTWTFESQAFRGERAGGQWTVRVVDDAAGDTLTVTDIVIRVIGDFSPDDRYVFTNELSDYAGILGHVTNVVDTNFGTDTVNASAVTTGSVIRLDGVSGQIDGVGMTFANIEHAIGGDGGDQIHGNIQSNQLFGMRGADSLFGGENTDFLYGGTNDDMLDGGLGADTMTGGTGNDTFFVNTLGDLILDAAGQGTLDHVLSTGNYILAAGAEIERLSANDPNTVIAMNLFGNELSQLISGNNGVNALSSGAAGGTDTLRGFGGNDVYRVFNSTDLIIETAGGGTGDRVVSTVNFTLAADDDIEFLNTDNGAGVVALNLTGNALSQWIIGNSGANILSAGATGGADTLQGLGGADVYRVFNSGDIIIEVVGGGTDRVATAVDFNLAADDDIETLVTNGVAGLTAIDLRGNALAQRLQGNNGANILNGLGGSDTLTGFAGADTFAFNSALGATNTDVITDYSVAADHILLENAVFIGLAAGVLAATAFSSSITGLALDASDRIMYETDTGLLWFDQDGNAGGFARVKFADLAAGLLMAASEFAVA